MYLSRALDMAKQQLSTVLQFPLVVFLDDDAAIFQPAGGWLQVQDVMRLGFGR